MAAHRDFLRLHANGTHYDFHWFWLRHQCPDGTHCRHPKTGERTLDAADVPLDIQPVHVTTAGDAHDETVVVEWGPTPHAHASHFNVAWLVEHAYGKGHTEVAPPESDASRVIVAYGDYAAGPSSAAAPAYFDALRARLRRYGVVVVTGRGLDTEAIM